MPNRLAYLDALKIVMTVLVVLHHTSITYGGAGSWFYYETPKDELSPVLLTLFTVVNQSFFMGLFFFISGYVTPDSYDRKGAAGFMRDRLRRCGVPMLVFMLIFSPLLRYIADGYPGTFWQYAKQVIVPDPFRGVFHFDVGPLWFLFALLLFGGGYTAYRMALGKGWIKVPAALSMRMIMLYLVAVGLLNYLVRLFVPVGEEVMSLQLGYFPAYVGLFAGGIAARRGKWLDKLTVQAGRRWAWTALGAFVLIPVGMAFGGALEGDTSAFMGGFTWQSALYSGIEPILGFGISFALLVWFRERWNRQSAIAQWLSARAFTVYIVHALVVTYISIGMKGMELHALVKFGIAGLLAVPCCFLLATVFHKIPLINRYL